MKSDGFTVEAIRVDDMTGEIVVEIGRPALRNHGDPEPRIAGDLEVRYRNMAEVPFQLTDTVQIALESANTEEARKAVAGG